MPVHYKFLWALVILPAVFPLCASCDAEPFVPNEAPGGGQPTRTVVSADAENVSGTATLSPETAEVSAYQTERDWMVDQTIIPRGITDPDVLRAMRTVPRHAFVSDDYQGQAYEDHPLPIGYGQTISQPYIVAWMTELLQLQDGDKVLEIGTGSGYQAAVLAELGFVEVFSVEIVPELAVHAAERLNLLGYRQVHVQEGNGYYGWEDNAPYDAIIVTAAPDHIPQALLQQLGEGGVLVIPIGPPGGYQALWQFIKTGDTVQAHDRGGVRFVPFTAGGVEEALPALP